MKKENKEEKVVEEEVQEAEPLTESQILHIEKMKKAEE